MLLQESLEYLLMVQDLSPPFLGEYPDLRKGRLQPPDPKSKAKSPLRPLPVLQFGSFSDSYLYQ